MSSILIQNTSHVYVVIVKTRRYRSLLKLYVTPFLIVNIFSRLIFSKNHVLYVSSSNYLMFLSKYFLDSNLWYFLSNITFNNSGLILNNIEKSYTFYTLSRYLKFISKRSDSNPSYFKFSILSYVKHIKIIPFSLNKNIFKKNIIYILYTFIKFNFSFINNLNISYSFLFLSKDFNLYLFYCYYYFKVHNY